MGKLLKTNSQMDTTNIYTSADEQKGSWMTVKKGILMVMGAGAGLGAVMYARSQELPATGHSSVPDITSLDYYDTEFNCAWYVYENTGGNFGPNGYDVYSGQSEY